MPFTVRLLPSSIILLFIIALDAGAQGAYWWKTPFDANGDPVTAITTHPGGVAVVGTAHNGIYGSLDSGSTWVRRNGDLTNLNIRGVALSGFDMGSFDYIDIMAVTAGGGSLNSIDGGATWRRDHSIPRTIIESITPYDVQGAGLCAATDNGVYRLASHSAGLDSVTNQWDTAGLHGKHITKVIAGHSRRVDGAIGHYLFATDAEGISYQGFSHVASGKQVFDWTPMTLPVPGFTAMARGVNGWNDSLLFAGAGRQIFRSTDYGHTWRTLYFVGDTITAITMNHNKHIFVGTVDGILRSTDTGETWVRIDDGLNHKRITTLELDRSTGYIYAGTASGQVYRTVGLSGVHGDNEPTADALVLRSEPNPVNTEAFISFALSRPDKVTLTIFDMEGREVTRLVDGRLETGAHEMSWRTGRYPAGIYHCRLQVGSTVTSRVIVVIH